MHLVHYKFKAEIVGETVGFDLDSGDKLLTAVVVVVEIFVCADFKNLDSE